MIINVGDDGGVIVQDFAPEGNSTLLWIDTGNEGVPKYWNGTEWVPVPSVWA